MQYELHPTKALARLALSQGPRLSTGRRWAVVAACAVILLLTPFLLSRIPVTETGVSASALLARIQASADVGYSGYAEASGGLALPVSSSDFGSLADLLGGRTDLRVWWRGPSDWRVDTVDAVGEKDVHQDATGIWSWDYERNQASRLVFAAPPEVRLPRADDLAPPSLARRLLSQARPSEVTRLPGRRIAGHDAAGLRLRPAERRSTIARVDVWALRSGLALQVDVYGRTGPAALNTALLDVSTKQPSTASTRFLPPLSARVSTDTLPDLVAAIDQFARVTPPRRLAGLTRSRGFRTGFGSVGVYGRAVTRLVALPLPPRLADDLARQLSGAAAVTQQGDAASLQIGPMTVRLTARAFNGTRWLLAGTVTPKTLQAADTQLPVPEGFFR